MVGLAFGKPGFASGVKRRESDEERKRVLSIRALPIQVDAEYMFASEPDTLNSFS